MAAKKAERKKAERKEKLKKRRQKFARSGQLERAEFFFYEALMNEEEGNLEKATHQMEKAVNSDPKNDEYIHAMGRLAHFLGRADMELINRPIIVLT